MKYTGKDPEEENSALKNINAYYQKIAIIWFDNVTYLKQLIIIEKKSILVFFVEVHVIR